MHQISLNERQQELDKGRKKTKGHQHTSAARLVSTDHFSNSLISLPCRHTMKKVITIPIPTSTCVSAPYRDLPRCFTSRDCSFFLVLGWYYVRPNLDVSAVMRIFTVKMKNGMSFPKMVPTWIDQRDQQWRRVQSVMPTWYMDYQTD